MNLPSQLQNPEFRFIRVDRNKFPIVSKGESWKKPEYQYSYDKLPEGDAGIIAGNGLIILDLDLHTEKEAEAVMNLLGPTFCVQSGSEFGYHFYYFCPDMITNKKIELGNIRKQNFSWSEKNKVMALEVRAKDMYVVIPGSMHASGKPYRAFNNLPIASIHKEKILFINKLYGLFGLDSKLAELFFGNWEKYYPGESRSEAEMGLCTMLCQHGFEKQEIFDIMAASALGKWQDKPDSYKELTYSKAWSFAEAHPLEKRKTEPKERQVGTIQALINEPLPEIEYYVEPMIPKGSLILFGGKPSSFKSMLVLDMGLHISTGQKYLDSFETKKNSRILLYDLENGERIIARRLQYLINGSNGLKNSDFCVSYDFDKQNIESERKYAEDFDIIVLDSYRRFLRGEENSSEITDAFYKEFLKPLRDAGKTIIILHHFRKSRPEDLTDEDLQDLFRGSSDLPAQVDIVYGLIKTQEELEGGQICFNVSVIPSKNRLGIPIRAFILSVKKDDPTKKTTITFEKYGYLSADDETQEIIKKALAGKTLKRAAIIEIVKVKTRLSIPTIDRRIKDMEAIGLIAKTKYGTYSLPKDRPDNDDNLINSDRSLSTLSVYQHHQDTQLNQSLIHKRDNCKTSHVEELRPGFFYCVNCGSNYTKQEAAS